MQDAMKQVRYKQWAQMVVDRKNSGMTIKDYCAANGLTVDQYGYRATKLRDYAAGMLPPEYLPKPKKKAIGSDNDPAANLSKKESAQSGDSKPLKLVEIQTSQSENNGIIIQFHEALIKVSEGTSRSLLSNVMEVLSHVQ